MKVSIVVSVFESVSEFEVTLRTISQQTIRDIEILVVDDGNNFVNSQSLVRICGRDTRTRIIRNDCNVGLTASLIRGCSEAKAPFIARIDNGDLMVPENRLELQLAQFASDLNLAIVGGQVEIIDELNAAVFRSRLKMINDEQLRKYTYSVSRFNHVTVMMRKSFYELCGGYDSSCRTGQDRELWPRLMEQGRGVSLPIVFAVAPMRASSISVARNNEQIENKIFDLKKKKETGQITSLVYLMSVVKNRLQLFLPIRLRVFLRYSKNMNFVKFISRNTVRSTKKLYELYFSSSI